MVNLQWLRKPPVPARRLLAVVIFQRVRVFSQSLAVGFAVAYFWKNFCRSASVILDMPSSRILASRFGFVSPLSHRQSVVRDRRLPVHCVKKTAY